MNIILAGKMLITDYAFGRITIDGKTFSNDVIINGHKIIPEWWRKKGHLADIDDLKDVPLKEATHLIIGTGYYGMMKINPSLEEYCRKHGIILESMRTASAVEMFNRCDTSEKFIGAFHLTC